jgi:putative membrane protein
MSDQISGSAAELGTNTRLAYERTRLAYERTMMAWVRTGTSLITFGFSVYKFFQLEIPAKAQGTPLIGAREFALGLILIGLLSLLLGTMEHRRDLRAMRAQYAGMPRSMSVVVAVLIAALGLIALVAVVFRA